MPFPEEWRAIVLQHVPYTAKLPAVDLRLLEGHIQILLAEKNFEGCGGLELTDEIRLTVAANAALLVLHLDSDYYPTLDSILVYPSSFVAKGIERVEGNLEMVEEEWRDGEAWMQGAVILAWDGVLQDAYRQYDGFNVALHEFAHQLDMEDGAPNGVPYLPSRAMYARWGEICTREYERLCNAADAGRPTVIDPYGAEDPAEFFAVVTEAFFEIPRRLSKHHPELYQLFKEYYRQDPLGVM